MDKEDYLDQLVEIIQVAARAQGGKTSFIVNTKEATHIPFSKNTSYRSLLIRVMEEEAEEEFCQAIFNVNDFDEIISRNMVVQGLSLLNSREIFEIADYFSDDRHSWKYDKSSASKTVAVLSERVSLIELNECISVMMSEGRIELSTRQNKKWVIGPLGITQAKEYRKASQVWSLKTLIEEELPNDLINKFINKADWLPTSLKLSSNANQQHRKQELIQLVLTYGSGSNILSAFNKLIADGLVSVKTIRTYDWNLMGTPCGVFPKQYDGVNRLTNLILNKCTQIQLKLQLSQKGHYSDDIRLGTIEMCLRENPVSILDEFFGWADLMKIGQELDLVQVQGVPKLQLAEVIALNLGFELPGPIEGIADFLGQVEKGLISMSEPDHSKEELVGMMTGIYRTTEAMLKDIIHFYVGFIWEDATSFEEQNTRRETFNNFCKKQFGIEKADGVDGLTLGELIGLFYKLNDIVKHDLTLQNKFFGQFRRKTVIPSKVLLILEDGMSARKYLVHDKGRINKLNNTIVNELIEALNKIKEFLHRLKQDGYYPYVIRVKKEVTDEFGRRYIEAIDEGGKSWLIYSQEYLFPNESYFMHCVTDHIAIDPFLSSRF